MEKIVYSRVMNSLLMAWGSAVFCPGQAAHADADSVEVCVGAVVGGGGAASMQARKRRRSAAALRLSTSSRPGAPPRLLRWPRYVLVVVTNH